MSGNLISKQLGYVCNQIEAADARCTAVSCVLGNSGVAKHNEP